MQRDWQIPVTLVALTVGLLLSTQFKSQADFRRSVPSRRVEDLQVLLRSATEGKDNLEKEVTELRRQLKDQGKSSSHDELPGWTALKGPGLEITIEDSEKPLQKGEDPNTATVHNDDLLRMANELRSGGAEAIAVNDQRLIDTTEIACAGSTILVNRSRVAAPFVIRAIGDRDTLYSALRMRGGIVDYLQFYGIQVNISKKAEVIVPMFRGGNALKLAKPADRS